jgi:AcrR family transcriptional regulator
MMSPRRPSVNEEMRRRSRERLLQATVELVAERGYAATTLADIADRAGTARGLVSYYFPGKRQLLQSAVHRLMHREIAAAVAAGPAPRDGAEHLARAIDCVLGLPDRFPVLMREHMAGILQAEGFLQCPEQRRLAAVLREAVAAWAATRRGTGPSGIPAALDEDVAAALTGGEPDAAYLMLRAQLMGAVFAQLIPGASMPAGWLRPGLFRRYGLPWEYGFPPGGAPFTAAGPPT